MTVKIKRSWVKSAKDALYNLIEVLWAELLVDLAALNTLGTAQRTWTLMDRVLSSPGLGIGSTDRNVANIAFDFQIGASAAIVNTFKKGAAVAAGTALAAGTIPADKWGLYLFVVDATDAKACVAAAANFTTGYASEAAAVAALPAAVASKADMGYVTVKTAVGQPFVGGTDSLKTGAAGNVASETNYYNAGANFRSPIGAAVTITAESVTVL
jgi:hypothetical protein